MGLKEMFGKTDEILLFDFFAQNMDMEYTIEEVAKWLKMPIETVKEKLAYLIYNGLIVQENEKFTLLLNTTTKHLINAVFANSVLIADYDDEENIEIEKIKTKFKYSTPT